MGARRQFCEVTTENGRAVLRYRRWVKKDGRVKFQERWFQSVYLNGLIGNPVMVAQAPGRDALLVGTNAPPYRFITIALPEAGVLQ